MWIVARDDRQLFSVFLRRATSTTSSHRSSFIHAVSLAASLSLLYDDMSPYSVVVYLYLQDHKTTRRLGDPAVVAVVKLFILFIRVVPKPVESEKTTNTKNTNTPYFLFIIVIAPSLTFSHLCHGMQKGPLATDERCRA